MGKMTFLDLQRQITQTRKARKGISNRRDYYDDENNNYEFDDAVYHKALVIANKVVQHYYETGEINPKEKISLNFGESLKAKKTSTEENQKLQKEIEILKKQLEKFHRGGRKSYDDVMIKAVKDARASGETWRGLAARLRISTTTAQKLCKLR